MKEATVEQKLQGLFKLQLIDSEIDKIYSIRGELPMEVADLEDEIAGLQTRIEKLTADVSTLKKSIDEQNASIKNSNALIVKYESQQSSVKNNREFLALSKEVELQKLEIMASDKKIKEFKLQQEDKKLAIETTKQNLEDRKKDLEIKKVELHNIAGETEKEEKFLLEKRSQASDIIDARYLKGYKRIRAGVKNKLAVVTIDRDACAGCYSKVPPQRQLDIRLRKKIAVCENCGRILVDGDLSVELKTTMDTELAQFVS